MGSLFLKAEGYVDMLKTCEVDLSVMKKVKEYYGFHYFKETFYCYSDGRRSRNQQLIIINTFNGQHRCVRFSNFPAKSTIGTFTLLQEQPNGHILGFIRLSAIKRYTPRFFYSIELKPNECCVLEKIYPHDDYPKSALCPVLNDPNRLIHRCKTPNFYSYTMYEFCCTAKDDKVVMKEIVKFKEPTCIGGWVSSGNFVAAIYKSREQFYLRNLVTGQSSVITLPKSIGLKYSNEHFKGFEDYAVLSVVYDDYSHSPSQYRISALTLNADGASVILDRKIYWIHKKCKHRRWVYKQYHDIEPIDDQTLFFSNDTPESLIMYRLSIWKPEKLLILALLASKRFIVNGQFQLPEDFPIKM